MTPSPWDQSRYAVRLDWGLRGAVETSVGAAVVVVVDVLSFTTAVAVAVDRGIAVQPFAWRDESAVDAADAVGATLAVGRSVAGPGEVSLSPLSIARADGVTRLVLPSPNGSSICAAIAGSGARVLAGSLRNAAAVGRWLADGTGPITLVPAGERWDDGSLRPAVEDLWGAGAVLATLLARRPALRPSPEAYAALAAYEGVRAHLSAAMDGCASARELTDRGYAGDVAIAVEADVSERVPLLVDGWFVAAGSAVD